LRRTHGSYFFSESELLERSTELVNPFETTRVI
jgi:hypothetical protein